MVQGSGVRDQESNASLACDTQGAARAAKTIVVGGKRMVPRRLWDCILLGANACRAFNGAPDADAGHDASDP